MTRFSRRRGPWLVPIATLAAVLGLGVLSSMSRAGAGTPDLAPLSAADLLARVRSAPPPSLSGTVDVTADLGLPSLASLGALGGPSTSTVTGLLSGSHQMQVWLDGTDRQRIALATTTAETDWIHNGTDAWSWDSNAQRVVHVTLPAPDTAGPDDPTGADDPADAPEATEPVQTPDQLAQQVLARIDPSTAVSVRTPVTVAGRPSYQLVISPRSDHSTIGEVTVSVDAATSTPLEVAVTARGAAQPALDVAFSSIDFTPPDASHFAFAAPKGATVVEAHDARSLLAPGAVDEEGGRHHRRVAQGAAPADTPPGPVPTTASGPLPSSPPPEAPDLPGNDRVTTVGQDWETVALLHGVTLPDQLTALVKTGQPITFADGQGTLVSTPLVNVVVADDGRIAIGAVTPDVLATALGG